MAYVAVQGGQEAIKESNLLLDYSRVKEGKSLDLETIQVVFRDLLFQVMSESSLYDEEIAALALKQAKGSMEEAVFLLRAHRSTLPRIYYTTITDTKKMEVERRISSSFKDIPGGQYLGRATDFKQRFLDFSLEEETKGQMEEKKRAYEERPLESSSTDFTQLPKVVDYIEKESLYKRKKEDNSQPDDITKRKIEFPSSRSQRLQSLTRGQTGAVTSLGYARIRGFGFGGHPNIGELRVGQLPLHIVNEQVSEEEYYIGSIEVTEVESFCSTDTKEDGVNSLSFEIGYGLVLGQNETKAIAMSVLDYSLEHPSDTYSPTSDDEFVLLHIDAVESSGFISHLKLPHYVTFQSELDGMRKIQKEGGKDNGQ